jgi:hypothetical protein
MPNFFPTLPSRHIAWMTVVACAVALGANFLPLDQERPRDVVVPAPAVVPVFGPGGRVDVGPSESLNRPAANLPVAIADASFATEERELVVNAELLQVFDFFLQAPDGQRADASTALRTFLAERLMAASVTKALQIAADYRSYMMQHDALLAAQNFDRRGLALSTLDVGRIKTWLQLRRRLRQSVLGEAVAEAWYQNDDAQLLHVLDQLQQAPNADALDESNRRTMQGIVDKATRRFTDRLENSAPQPG